MKSLIKALLRNIFSLIPFRLMRFFHSIWLDKIAADKDTAKAFINLFALSDDTEIRINLVAMKHDGNGIHVKHRLMKYHDFFVERLKPGETVLDIGCGCGAVAHSMASRADAHVVGIDLIEANITQARQNYSHPKLQFILGDALVSLPSGSYETIVMSNVLEHIESRVEFIKKAQSQIKPKRWLLRIPMINRHWSVIMRKELGIKYMSDDTHFTEYTVGSFNEEMKAAGLRVTELIVNWGEIWAEAVPESISIS